MVYDYLQDRCVGRNVDFTYGIGLCQSSLQITRKSATGVAFSRQDSPESGPLEDYISELQRMCLILSEVGKLTYMLVFVEGLEAWLKYMLKREHPTNLAAAVRAGLSSAELDDEDAVGGVDVAPHTDNPAKDSFTVQPGHLLVRAA